MIYAPREDSLLLAKIVKKYAKNKRVLDLGTGSGILAKEALKYTKDVTASDINKECLKALKSEKIKAIHSSLFEKIKGKFDLILFNPPYLPEDIREDKEGKVALCGGKQGYEIIFKFLEEAKSHLKKSGKILLVFSSLSKKDKIEQRLKEFPDNYRQFMARDFRAELDKYRLDYVLSVGLLPQNIIDQLGGVQLIFNSNNLFLYNF